jgi:tetratricopeptide (TPR) repeat protein
MKKKVFYCIQLVCLLCAIPAHVYSQTSNYQKAHEKLNEGQFFQAKELFEKATKDEKDKELAYLTLSMMHEDIGEISKSNEYFMKFFEVSQNPLPETFALWYNDGVRGNNGKMSDANQTLLSKIMKHPKYLEFSDGVINYNFGINQTFLQNEKMTNEYFNKIGQLMKFSLVGPFDNLVNNGFDKDFGALNLKNNSFKSKYGKEVSWFTPKNFYNDGYFMYNRYFINDDALFYAQSFVEVQDEQDVILKLGYSGVVKLWVNDSLVYSESQERVTEMDYYQIKMRLNKGFNRVLIQVGTIDRMPANFCIRLTDANHQLLKLNHTAEVQDYKKSLKNVSFNRSMVLNDLAEKSAKNPSEILYKLLLIKTYLRALEFEEAEEIASQLYADNPKNYLVLRELIFLNKKTQKGTLQNKYYEEYKGLYPEDKDILANNISEATEEKNLAKFLDLVSTYKKLYPSNQKDIMRYQLTESTLKEDYNQAINIIDKMYSMYPDDPTIVLTKYQLDKAMKPNSKAAIKILEKYFSKTYNYQILNDLVEEYWSLGNIKKAEALLKKSNSLTKFDEDAISMLTDIYFKRGDYQSAISSYQSILENRPNDHHTYNDLANLYQVKGDNAKALENYEKSLAYYPFTFDVHEKIRVLKSQKSILSQIDNLNVDEIIADYKSNFKATKKTNFDIVYNSESKIIYKSTSSAKVVVYIVKLNNEEALKTWQKVDLGGGGSFYSEVNEAKTIKSSGSKIDAERNRNSVVYTNLEVGDYIYLKYTEKQYYGGKSSKFYSDNFSFNSFNPAYILKYNLYTEPGLVISDTIINGAISSTKSELDGFEARFWEVKSPKIIEKETNMLPFNDIANRLHIAAKYTWDDITNWYSDLSKDQALIDFTIKDISNTLFPTNQTFSELEKAKMIYDFVLKNIQYSSIDFRQGSYIPQKASDVYITRLGDCKDVSTLYATIARNVGLKADLVLINTSNYGTNNVILPSINFNHCIVKVYVNKKPIYLELTDPNLPFGHLNSYHLNAAILDIPYGSEKSVNNKLKNLQFNEGYTSSVVRYTKLSINSKGVFEINCNATKTGRMVTGVVSSYYHKDSVDQMLSMKNSISSKFNSLVTMKEIKLVDVEPRNESVNYVYKYEVENDVNKIGTMNSIKIPFADKLLTSKLFESKERKSTLNYANYEDNEHYKETIEISVPSDMSFIEIPQNQNLTYKDFKFTLTFKQVEKNKLVITREFKAVLKNISPEEMPEFQAFMTKVLDSESTFVVYK